MSLKSARSADRYYIYYRYIQREKERERLLHGWRARGIFMHVSLAIFHNKCIMKIVQTVRSCHGYRDYFDTGSLSRAKNVETNQ